MKTAVEWLVEQVVNRTERVYFLKELEQAKEMEKEQIMNAWNNAINAVEKDKWESFEQYYNETFKSE
jgi:hypothetical protein